MPRKGPSRGATWDEDTDRYVKFIEKYMGYESKSDAVAQLVKEKYEAIQKGEIPRPHPAMPVAPTGHATAAPKAHFTVNAVKWAERDSNSRPSARQADVIAAKLPAQRGSIEPRLEVHGDSDPTKLSALRISKNLRESKALREQAEYTIASAQADFLESQLNKDYFTGDARKTPLQYFSGGFALDGESRRG